MKNYFVALGGGNEIGASCYYFNISGTKILIDAGMRLKEQRVFPDFAWLIQDIGGLSALDAFLLTHAHLDHCGAILRLHHEAPLVPKFATQATIDIAKVMLFDALKVSKYQKPEDWSIEYAEFTENLLNTTINSFSTVAFGETFQIGSTGNYAQAFSAGHILGATSYLLDVDGVRILHTGDFSLHDQTTIKGLDTAKLQDIDILVTETTYAYQPQYRNETIREQRESLVIQVSNIVKSGGRVLIPAFALGRAQEIARIFSYYFEEGLVQPFPVYLDGLVKSVCDVYDAHKQLINHHQGSKNDKHALYNQWVRPTGQHFYPTKKAVANLPPSLVISSSGMLLDNTRSSKYAQVFLPNPKDAIFFSGYLDDESPGYRLAHIENAHTVTINKKTIEKRAKVKRYHLSAHAPTEDICRLIEIVSPKKVILVHGHHQFSEDPSFVRFVHKFEKNGGEVYQASNLLPIYF